MRAATIDDGKLKFDDTPTPSPAPARCLRPRPRGRPQRRRHPPAQGRLPRPARLAAGHPGPRAGRRGRRRSARARALRRGRPRDGIVGGGGQAELAVVHERQLMPVPDALDWPAAGGIARGVHHRARRGLHAGRPAAGERLLVHGGAGGVGTAASSSARPPARRSPRRSATPDCATAVEELGAARGHRPRGLRGARPVRRRPRARRRAEPAARPQGARHARAHRRHRRRRGLQGRGQPARAHGQARDRSARRRCAPRPLEEKALTARRGAARAAAARAGRERAGRATFPLDEAAPPTTASPRAGSSARSSWSRLLNEPCACGLLLGGWDAGRAQFQPSTVGGARGRRRTSALDE